MSYRVPATLAFSPRQLAWIEATTTEATVRANLEGIAITTPRRATERLERAALVAGGALLAAGVYSVATSGPPLALLPGLAVLALGAARRALRRPSLTEDFRVEVITAAPRFEACTILGAAGDVLSFTRVELAGECMRWPAALDALSSTLAPDERLRVGVARHRAFRSVVWAYPLDP